MGVFERYLSVWVGLAILAGVLLGNLFPAVFSVLATLEFAHVNILIAVLIWLMIYLMMVKIDFSSLKNICKEPKVMLIISVVLYVLLPLIAGVLTHKKLIKHDNEQQLLAELM